MGEKHGTGNREDSTRVRGAWVRTGIFVGVYVLGLALGAVVVFRQDNPVFLWVWLASVALGLWLLIAWHSHAFVYECKNCGHVFEISVLKDLVSPHGVGRVGGWKYLRCPNCGKRDRARLLPRS